MKKMIFGCLVACTIILGACQKNENRENKNSTDPTSSVEKKDYSSTSENSSSNTAISSTVSSSSNSEPDNITLAYEQLIGKRFILGPLLYDGQDVNQAMNENNAPQNLVHDGTKLITFVDDYNVHIELAGAYRPDYDTSYTLTNNAITIDNDTIPYSVENDVISFSNWTTDVNGHTITWSFTQ